MITLMPIAIGVIVANLYYLQPLLHEVKGDFAIGTVATSVLITLVQVGYAAGWRLSSRSGTSSRDGGSSSSSSSSPRWRWGSDRWCTTSRSSRC